MPARLKELNDAFNPEVSRYAENVLHVTGRLFQQLPSVLAHGTMAELLIKQVVLSGWNNGCPLPGSVPVSTTRMLMARCLTVR